MGPRHVVLQISILQVPRTVTVWRPIHMWPGVLIVETRTATVTVETRRSHRV